MLSPLPLVVLSFILIGFSSCSFDNEYNSYADIPDYTWESKESLVYDIEIDEPGHKKFDLYYDIRYGLQYPFRNLYIVYSLSDTLGNPIKEGRQNLLLFEDKTGRPKGDGLGDIFDYEFLSLEGIELPHGKYKLSVSQIMRQEKLPYIMSFGIKIKENTLSK